MISGSGWSYVLIFAFAYLDAIFPVVPSETAVITAGVLAGSGKMSLPAIIVLAAGRRVRGRQHRVFDRSPLRRAGQAALLQQQEGA